MESVAAETAGFEAGRLAVLRYEGWSKEEVTVLSAKSRNDIRNPEVHAMFR